MTRAPMPFRLTEKPWIPVVDTDGNSQTVSLVELFTLADQLDGLAALPADQLIGIRHLLLGICYAAGVAPSTITEWEAMSKVGVDRARVITWLEKNTDRFDLFHPERPFFQRPVLVALITDDPEQAESTSWLFNGSAGDGQLHYNDRHADANPISPALAARLLVAKQSIGRGGPEKGKNDIAKALGDASSNSKWAWTYTRIVVAAIGPNLSRTLALNLFPQATGLQVTDAINLSWADRHRTTKGQRYATGYADALTFQSRSLALTHTVDEHGQILVTGSKVAPGEAFLVTSDSDERATPEMLPWLAWSVVPNPKESGQFLLTAAKCAWAQKSLWRDQHAWFAYAASHTSGRPTHGLLGILGELDEDTLTLEFAGAQDQGNKIVAMAVERTTVPTKVLVSQDVVAILTNAVTFANTVNALIRKHTTSVVRSMNVHSASGAWASIADQASTLFWPELDHRYQGLLGGLAGSPADQDAALSQWVTVVENTALSAFDVSTQTLPKRDGETYKLVVNERQLLGEAVTKIKPTP